ncbi:uncharacterized protein UV8b_05565 [Ustilaginoidea virens]|uniref:Enoyl reductase (ER) domain-containing protein n=1 Tax=Ustilaginoidea virens TaxID=1159556 RepID=A0A8E5MJ70_USTVR|nr:uncharacterized protein UV8b_05565 [Ustilaginoidea virens]QUC21322.1 hypothetical protein UV8b_05565 [Ustilaginoidea virens]
MATEYKFEGWMGLDADSANGNMVWQEYEPKPWEETDIDIKVTNSAVCGSDVCTLSSAWGPTPYPCVVGHEIVGVAVRVGSKAEGGIKVGDIVGVGAQSDSCLGRDGPCQECSNNCESYCAKVVGTYASVHRNGAKSYGGHGSYHRCPSHFVIRIPEGLAPEHAAPLLCGGITVYSPLKHFGAGPGTKVAVAGASKRQEALELGCDEYIATDDDDGWVTHNTRRFHLIICTVSSDKMPLQDYVDALRFDGTLVQVGVFKKPMQVGSLNLAMGRRRIAGSIIGSPSEIREMLQLVVDKNIKPWVEKRPMKDANQVMMDMQAGKARFRYVLQN